MDSTVTPSPASPMPAVAAILSRYDRNKLASFIEVAISLLDTLDANPEAEEHPLEDAFVSHDPYFAYTDSDGSDVAWAEWHTRGRHKLVRGEHEAADQCEDDEDDDPDTSAEDVPEGFDPEQDRCSAGDDGVFSGAVSLHDVMKPDYGPGDSVDEERQQMADDVPCIPIFTLEPNVFNGQRQLLGYTLPRPTKDGTMEPEL